MEEDYNFTAQWVDWQLQKETGEGGGWVVAEVRETRGTGDVKQRQKRQKKKVRLKGSKDEQARENVLAGGDENVKK